MPMNHLSHKVTLKLHIIMFFLSQITQRCERSTLLASMCTMNEYFQWVQKTRLMVNKFILFYCDYLLFVTFVFGLEVLDCGSFSQLDTP